MEKIESIFLIRIGLAFPGSAAVIAPQMTLYNLERFTEINH